MSGTALKPVRNAWPVDNKYFGVSFRKHYEEIKQPTETSFLDNKPCAVSKYGGTS
jgi:hypothetical protein